MNPTALEPDPMRVRITPQHVHRALRHRAGLDTGAFAEDFPIDVPDLPLFGA